MISRLLNTWRPAVYHGNQKKANFFEGWFYKLCDASGDNVYAIIPGVFFGKAAGDSHAFIQLLNGQDHSSEYLRFPISEFDAVDSYFALRIGKNYFNSQTLQLNLTSSRYAIRGNLALENLKPWPVRLCSPGAMGWYAFVPFMECYHGILSLDHELAGTLHINGRNIDFSGGRGYLEKDWGSSFPEAYIWIQSNHFETPGTSLTASVAKIPWRGSAFRGFIIGFWWQNRLYRFTTYSGANLNFLEITDQELKLEVKDRWYRLQVTVQRGDGGVLHGPYDNRMQNRVFESLNSRVEVSLYSGKKGSFQLLYTGSGKNTGLDMNGKLQEITGRNSRKR